MCPVGGLRTALKNIHRSAASDEHTPMSRRFARVRTMISAAMSSQPDGKCAGCERWILHAAILEAISIRRGMFAPPRPELLACVWYSLARYAATAQPDGFITEQAGVGIRL